MKTIQEIFTLTALLLTIWQCTTPEPKARLWQSYIPEGYTLRDSVRGDLNLDSIPDFLLVLDSIAALTEAPKRLLLLLYGAGSGKYEMAALTNKLLHDQRSGNTAPIEPYEKAAIGAGFFAVWQRGGIAQQLWTYKTRFGLDTISGEWYLDRTVLAIRNGEDTLALAVEEKQVVRDTHDFGRMLLQDFDIATLKELLKDTSTRDDRFITYNFFKTNKLIIPAVSDDLDSIAALRALFPGRFFRDYEKKEDANVVFWLCENCPKIILHSYDFFIGKSAEKYEFPDKFANFTQITGVLTYRENNILHKAIFFSTANDFPVAGHFVPGILSIGIFQKKGDLWNLTAFSPHVAAEGDYSKAHAPDTVITAGGQSFFELNGGNSNFNGANYYYRAKFIFGLPNNVPSVVFHDPDGACYPNGVKGNPTTWASDIQFVSRKNDFPELLLITTGHFQKDEEELPGWERIPWLKKQISQHPGQDSFDFKVERRFRFNGKKYVPVQ